MTIEEIRKNAPDGATHYMILCKRQREMYQTPIMYIMWKDDYYYEWDQGMWIGEPCELPSDAMLLY